MGVDSGVLVGIDIGSSRIKAAAYDASGRPLAVCARETPRRAGLLAGEDDFPVLACLDAVMSAVAGLELGPRSISALGLSSMGEVGTLLDDGALVDLDFPAWYDPRGIEVVERLEARFGRPWLSRATGNHTVTSSTAAKLAHQLAGDAGSGTFLGLCGAFAWLMTGEAWQEAGLATTSGAFDPVGRTVLPEIWNVSGLGSVDLPRVLDTGATRPAVTELAGRLGLRPGAPVVIAGHDHPVATLGAGVLPGEVADSLGTGEAILAGLEGAHVLSRTQAALVDEPALGLEVWPGDGTTLVVWGKLRPGLAMRTFLAASGSSRDRLDGSAPAPGRAGTLGEDVAAALQRGETPDIEYGPTQWGALVDHYVAAAVEGRGWLRRLTGAAGAAVLTGGGLRSRRWRHAHAVLADSALAVSTVVETGTRGAAAVAGTALGWWPSASEMPGATRVEIRPGSVDDVDRAAEQLGLDVGARA